MITFLEYTIKKMYAKIIKLKTEDMNKKFSLNKNLFLLLSAIIATKKPSNNKIVPEINVFENNIKTVPNRKKTEDATLKKNPFLFFIISSNKN